LSQSKISIPKISAVGAIVSTATEKAALFVQPLLAVTANEKLPLSVIENSPVLRSNHSDDSESMSQSGLRSIVPSIEVS